VDEFNKVATTPLEEWIEFLKTEKIRPDTTTPGLQEARRKMNFYSLSKAEQEAYRFYVDEFNIQKESVESGYDEGAAQASIKIARKMLAEGLPPEQIARITGLSPEYIDILK
jgi:predicted transposase/invertase (TIGR01784 family)